MPLIAFIAIPILAIFLNSTPADFVLALQERTVHQALSLSFFTSITTTLLTILLGTPAAYLLATRRFRFHRLLDTLLDLPTVLPPSVAGVALLMAFGRKGLLGPVLESAGIHLAFTLPAVILAQFFIASPFFVRAAMIGFSSVDTELKQAAALDGATRWQVFSSIVLPLSWMSLLSGAVMTWARALGEFGATILFAGNFPGRTQTMPLAIYIGFEVDLKVALALSLILICISFAVLALVKGYLQNRFER